MRSIETTTANHYSYNKPDGQKDSWHRAWQYALENALEISFENFVHLVLASMC